MTMETPIFGDFNPCFGGVDPTSLGPGQSGHPKALRRRDLSRGRRRGRRGVGRGRRSGGRGLKMDPTEEVFSQGQGRDPRTMGGIRKGTKKTVFSRFFWLQSQLYQ